MTLTEVYNIKVLPNLFSYASYDYKNDIWYSFLISYWDNDFDKLIEHLSNIKLQIGYNNNFFSYPIVHDLILNRNKYKLLSGMDLFQTIFDKAQSLKNAEFPSVNDKKKIIKQIDLMRIWHYGSKARFTTLADLKIMMRLKNVKEYNSNSKFWIKEEDQEKVIESNKNNVFIINEFRKVTLGETEYPLYKNKNKIALRLELKKAFNMPCINYPDVRIGESIICKIYSKLMHLNEFEFKKTHGTERTEIKLKDCIPHWCNFESKEFNDIKSKFESTILTSEDIKFSCSTVFHGCKMDYGKGGVHSCTAPGIYTEDDYYTIIDDDVTSMYPNLSINLNLYPEHLGPQFVKIYNDNIVSIRMNELKKPIEEQNTIIIECMKYAANGAYGKSIEKSSPLHDFLYAMKITVAGQMFLSLYTEKLAKYIPEIKFIAHNTDGIIYMIPKKDIDKANAVRNEMTKLTGMVFKTITYKKLVIKDVNDFIAVYSDSTPEKEHLKLKGCFEIDKEFHKDPSMRIVPIALKNYYVNNIPIQDTIKNHNDIFDFCIKLKANPKDVVIYKYLENNEIKEDAINCTTRYFVSNSGNALVLKDQPNAKYSVTFFNDFVDKDMSDYNINYGYYINEAMKIKNDVWNGQLTLF